MYATSSEAHGRSRATGAASQRGFTLPELIAVLLMVAVLSVVAAPKLQGALSFRDDGWRDQISGALRMAHKTAIGHRRLVCADVGAAGVTLTIAAANPATTCTATLPGINGQSQVASAGGAAAASVSPSGTLYFQPSGRVSTDGAGSNAADRSISISGQTPIVLVGETGHVE